MQVQTLIVEEEAKGNLVTYVATSKKISTVARTPDAVAARKQAMDAHPYLVGKNRLASNSKQDPVTSPKLSYSQDSGGKMNFDCLNRNSYRPTSNSAEFLSEIVIDRCSLCGGVHDPFERFFATVAHCSETRIWEGPIWETVGSRENFVDFSGSSKKAELLQLDELFLTEGAKILDIRTTNYGPSLTTDVSEEEFFKDGCYSVLPEGTKEALNLGDKYCQVFFIPFDGGSGEVEGRYSLSVRWLEKEHALENYPIYLSLQAFSEHRNELAAVLAWASFESSFKQLESSLVGALSKKSRRTNKKIWDKKWREFKGSEEEKRTGSSPAFWKYTVNFALSKHELRSVDEISPSLTAQIQKLNKERQFVHKPAPSEKERKEMFKMLCAGIFGTKLCRALVDLESDDVKNEFLDRLSLKVFGLEAIFRLEARSDLADRCFQDAN